jgi:hypothetical protein
VCINCASPPFREKGAKIDVGNPMKRAHAKLLSRRYTTVSMLLLSVSTPHIVGVGMFSVHAEVWWTDYIDRGEIRKAAKLA